MIILSLIFFTLEMNMLGYFLFHIGAVLDVCKEDKSLESAHAFPLI